MECTRLLLQQFLGRLTACLSVSVFTHFAEECVNLLRLKKTIWFKTSPSDVGAATQESAERSRFLLQKVYVSPICIAYIVPFKCMEMYHNNVILEDACVNH